jgi:hypothetical protein
MAKKQKSVAVSSPGSLWDEYRASKAGGNVIPLYDSADLLGMKLPDDWDDSHMGQPSPSSNSVPKAAKEAVVAKASGEKYQSCYVTHKPMPLPGGKAIYGGNCHNPVVKDADVYVALDGGYSPTNKSWPWARKAEEVYYKITDMDVPKSPKNFKAMIDWLVTQIEAGKKVHVGCIGGHGRTGIVLSAVYAKMSGNKDAITYVRKNYCDKAVETAEQIDFLAQHFGIKKAKATKSWENYFSEGTSGGPYAKGGIWDKNGKFISGVAGGNTPLYATPVKNALCIWGKDGVIER